MRNITYPKKPWYRSDAAEIIFFILTVEAIVAGIGCLAYWSMR